MIVYSKVIQAKNIGDSKYKDIEVFNSDASVSTILEKEKEIKELYDLTKIISRRKKI